MGLINIADCRLLNMIAKRIDNDKFRMCDINICNQLLTHNVVVMIINKEKKEINWEKRDEKKKSRNLKCKYWLWHVRTCALHINIFESRFHSHLIILSTGILRETDK